MNGKPRKIKVLYMAAIKPLKSGVSGGQVSGAGTLFFSPLQDVVDLIPLSFTMPTSPPLPMYARLGMSVLRFASFLWKLPQADVVFFFLSGKLNVMEKGLMSMIARACGRGVVLRPESGHLIAQCEASPAFRKWLGMVLRNAHVVCTQGTFWSEFFATEAGSSANLVRVPNAITMPETARTRDADARPRRIAIVTTVCKEKGIFEALKVFERAANILPDVVLSIAGTGVALNEVRERVKAMGLETRVELMGWQSREQVQELLSRSDVFLFPSHTEGMPNSVLEAMALGVPCVTSRVGALADVIVNGRSGYITGVGDIDALSDSVNKLLADPQLARTIGNAGRDAVQVHEVGRVWPIYAELYYRAAVEARRIEGGRQAMSSSSKIQVPQKESE
jgi:glycosyltransferase involved in cell wall biosynthesis